MNVGGGEARKRSFHVTAGDGEGQLPVRDVFDAVDTTGKDAVVHPGFRATVPSNGA